VEIRTAVDAASKDGLMIKAKALRSKEFAQSLSHSSRKISYPQNSTKRQT